jgi:hypothetical protein
VIFIFGGTEQKCQFCRSLYGFIDDYLLFSSQGKRVLFIVLRRLSIERLHRDIGKMFALPIRVIERLFQEVGNKDFRFDGT